MKHTNGNNGLNILHATPKTAGHEWCHRLRMRALDAALKYTSSAKLTAADVVNLMKIRKSLVEQIREESQIIWQDPPHWNPVPEPGQSDLAA